ncbi:hypothetical protein SAMN04488580_101437 [Mycobacterium sp. 283mftsu]|nr:hypothetical protein SAMN04488580_101437 [Mycobacterium sp. 283mftsu]
MTGRDLTRGVLAGAVLGGIGWGLLAVGAMGPGDDPHLDRVDGTNLTAAVCLSLICLLIAALLSRARVLTSVAVALVVAPASVWFIVGLLYLQAVATVTMYR